MTLFVHSTSLVASVDAMADRVDTGGAGNLKIYAGSIPADADAALGGATLLGTLAMSATAFAGASYSAPTATATAAAISNDTSADATGTAAFFRIENGAGTVIFQGQCGTSGQQLNLNTLSIQIGAIISVTSLTLTQDKS